MQNQQSDQIKHGMQVSEKPSSATELLRKADEVDDMLPQSAPSYGFRITGILSPSDSPVRFSENGEQYHLLVLTLLG